MADILIKGIEMPTKGYRLILIHADGTVQTTDGETTAISVPPHGRLIDADALVDSFDPSDFWNPDAQDSCFAAIHVVNLASTVIPSSKEGIE